MTRAGFMHRHSRHVPMLVRPGRPKHNEEIYCIIFLLYYGLSIYNSKRTKTPEYIEQINITNNRIKNDKFISMFSTLFYVQKSRSLSPVLSHRRTHSTDTHSRTRGDADRTLPREFISKIVPQLKSYMTFLSSEGLEAVRLKDSLLVDSAAEHCWDSQKQAFTLT